MKKLLIIHQNMEIGGAETSLISLLWSLDYSQISVDLFLYEVKGELLEYVPTQVNIVGEKPEYKALVSPIVDALKNRQLCVANVRIVTKILNDIYRQFHVQRDVTYVLKQKYHYYSLLWLPKIPGQYDMAISFNDPHFIIASKVSARTKLGWFHTDCSRIDIKGKLEKKMWLGCDYVVNVSDSCKAVFDEKHPYMVKRSIVIENILSKELIEKRAEEICISEEMPEDGYVRLLSIGRFSNQKNFDNVPDICRRILDLGCKVKWYLIGYGNDEELIRRKIAENSMHHNVIILGKKENPYPYIKACDIYVQPSRYEGKCVAVREAQILHKPVVITNYATANSQLTDGYDGIVVPMENEECALKIARFINNKLLIESIITNVKKNDYTNAAQAEKLIQLMERKCVN